MRKCLPANNFITQTGAISMQVFFIFVFLTVFFFSYVQIIEKNSVKKQVKFVVEDITKDFNINDFIPKSTDKEDLVLLVKGAVAVGEEKILQETKETNKQIEEQNRNVIYKGFSALGIILGLLLILYLSFYVLGYCLPYRIHFKESVIVVMFVALTEFMFLMLIGSRYIAIDPNEVRTKFGQSLIEYVDNRQK